jgi:N,N'-diacetyllegionaminate synthase
MNTKRVLIIAEAGVNHNGCLKQAKRLIDAAVAAKVDLVKFQTFKADTLVTKNAPLAKYQADNIEQDESNQNKMLKSLELSHDDHIALIDYCKKKGIQFFSTAFDLEGLDYLYSLDFNMFKIPSGEITNYPYLKKLAEFGKPVILSTGMSESKDIKDALKVLTTGITLDKITVLHCNTEYPTPMQDVNLRAMLSIKDEFEVDIGYSDHTLGIELPIAAVALGASVIEKHFTLDRNLPGPDHRASLEPNELIDMVKGIRNIEIAISGDGIKTVSKSEEKNRLIARKSIYSLKVLKKNSFISEEDIITLRPATGICAMEWENVIGKRLNRDVKAFEVLNHKDLI